MKDYIDLKKFDENIKKITEHLDTAKRQIRKFIAYNLYSKICKN